MRLDTSPMKRVDSCRINYCERYLERSRRVDIEHVWIIVLNVINVKQKRIYILPVRHINALGNRGRLHV